MQPCSETLSPTKGREVMTTMRREADTEPVLYMHRLTTTCFVLLHTSCSKICPPSVFVHLTAVPWRHRCYYTHKEEGRVNQQFCYHSSVANLSMEPAQLTDIWNTPSTHHVPCAVHRMHVRSRTYCISASSSLSSSCFWISFKM